MKIAGLVQDSIVDGPGWRFTVFTQGCPHQCEGCHNPDTHDPAGGSEMDVEEVIRQMLSNPLTDGITLSGGEPFAQPYDCFKIAKAAHEHGLNVWTYSGYTFEQLLNMSRENDGIRALLHESDALIDGPFILSQRSLAISWRGSRNQRVLDVKQSLASGEAVKLMD